MVVVLNELAATVTPTHIETLAQSLSVLLVALLGGRIDWAMVPRDDGRTVVVWTDCRSGEMVAHTDHTAAGWVARLGDDELGIGRTVAAALGDFERSLRERLDGWRTVTARAAL